MSDWRRKAEFEVFLSKINPNYTPRYRVPARRWWQFWKPRWEWVEGVSQNTIRRAHGYPARVGSAVPKADARNLSSRIRG